MLSARTVFLNMAKKFPAWMDIHKRPTTSVAGQFLQSIVDENDGVKIALENFKSDFFLVSYFGRENSILSKAYIYRVGNVEDDIKLVAPSLKVTTDAKIFIEKYEEYALFQEGFIVIAPKALPEDGKCVYTHANNTYGGKFTERALWNIFDEYAMFLGLKRYENEDNKSLMQRCLLVFKNRTNCSKDGLKNAIVNAISTQIAIDKDDIIFEQPDESNLTLEDDEFENIYERLAEFNRDAFKNKRWDMDTWEHNFKKLSWIPHIWDAPVPIYQDGTGQNNDLQVRPVDKNAQAKTNVEVYGYKKSLVAAEEYVRKRSIQRKIPLTLKQYKDQLRILDVNYAVTAEPAVKIKPHAITLLGRKKFDGKRTYKLADIMEESGGADKEQLGSLNRDGKYYIRFTPKTEFSPINIAKAIVSDGKKEENLLKETDGFAFSGTTLHNITKAIHVEKLTDASSYVNMQDSVNGMRFMPRCSEGEIIIDITKQPGEAIHLKHDGVMSDFSENGMITSTGFEYSDKKYKASSMGSNASIDFDIDCVCFEFDFLPPDEGEQQGSATVTITIDGMVDTINSGLWSSDRRYSRRFDRLTRVQVHIQKIGANPVSFGNFRSAAYDIKYSFEKGIPIITPQAILTPKVKGENFLHIQLRSYDANSPLIQYVHIGDSTKNLFYEIEHDFKAGTWLDIDSNCKVELYRDASGERLLEKEDFKTGILYKNNTSQTVRMAISLNDMDTIATSSVPVTKTTYKGKITSFISLAPGEDISEITVIGTGYAAARNYQISKLLGLSLDEEVYVAHNIKGFIIKNVVTGAERIARVEKSSIDKECIQFVLEGLPVGVTGRFVISTDKAEEGNSFAKPFANFYLVTTDDTYSIGYGRQRMVRQEASRISIPGNFSPELEDGKLYVYQLKLGEDVDPKNIQVSFEKNVSGKQLFESWSLGIKEYGINVRVGTELDNVTNYMSEEQKINNYYIVSTQIPLKDTFVQGDESFEYARYIIEPPNGMEVDYEQDMCGQDLIVEEDSFNKLWYALVPTINEIHCGSDIIPPSKYSVISEGGIVIWNTSEYTGKTVHIYYTYSKPVALSYTSIDALYDLIGYNIEALTLMNKTPVVIEDMVNGEYHDIIIDGQTPDNLLASCSNSDFQVLVRKNRITTTHLGRDTSNTVKTGYYYDQGKEYYFFEHQHKDKPSTEKLIETENASIMDNEFVFSQATSNYLLDSSMDGNRLDTASFFDMSAHDEIDGVSRLGAITACDSFHQWTQLDTEIELTGTNSNRRLHFKPTSKLAYALLEISKGVKKNSILTYTFDGELTGTIMKENQVNFDSMRKSVFCSYYAKVTSKDGVGQFIFDDQTDETYRYFLMLNGEGSIDDIIIKEYSKDEDVSKLHKKNIESLHMEIEEEKPVHFMEEISFDIHNNVMTNTEITSDGTIRTGSNVDYGVTKIFDSRINMDMINNDDGVFIRKDSELYTEDTEGEVTITGIPVPSHSSVKDVYVKINDVTVKGLNNFDVRIATSENKKHNYQDVRFVRKTNLAPAYSVTLQPYMQIEIKVPAKSVITNVEIYVRYAEIGQALSVGVNNHGELLSKVYDTLFSGSYKPARIEGTAKNFESIKLFIRGCRINRSGEAVWTNWYNYELDSQLSIVGDPHIFDGYRLFQFLVDFNSSDARLSIDKFIFEVV